MQRYGMRDLFFHMMYLCKREKLSSIRLTSIHQLLVFALSACYSRGYDLRYDILFEKSSYGARSNHLIENRYKGGGRSINLDYAACIRELEEDAELDSMFVWLIKGENAHSYRQLAAALCGSDPYLREKELIKEIRNSTDCPKFYPYWTKKDIVALLRPEEAEKVESKLPLKRVHFDVMCLYMKLDVMAVPFTRSQLMIFREMPYHLIRTAEEHGFYHDPDLD